MNSVFSFSCRLASSWESFKLYKARVIYRDSVGAGKSDSERGGSVGGREVERERAH